MANQIASWRVEETRIHRPNVLLGALFCAVFVAIGVGIWPLTAGSPLDGAPAVVNALLRNALPGLSVGLGLIGLAAIAWDVIRRRRPLRAAGPGVLPEVPTEPVNDTRRVAHAHVRHEIKSTDTGWSLVPRHRAINRTSLLVTAWIGLTVVGVNALLWSVGPDDQQRQKWWVTAASVMAGIGMTAVVWFVTRDSNRRARRMDVDLQQRTVHIDAERTVPLDDVVAIQICPLRIKIGPTPVVGKRWGYDADALEVNAVLRDSAGEIDRETLYVVCADLPGAAELAAELAGRLGVPLLNHATAEYWPAEIRRAKDRPYTFHGTAP
jgi:hypothetical protein